jgi:hypothetical protein
VEENKENKKKRVERKQVGRRRSDRQNIENISDES